MTRFYVQPTEIGSKVITLNEVQSKKIRKVLRMKVGDEIQVFDGNGWVYETKLTKITSSFSLAEVTHQTLHDRKSNITLFQALPKNLKIEFIVQKCTELGVDSIVFFESEFSQVDAARINKEKVRRWRSIAAQASEQAGRIFVPEISVKVGSLEVILKDFNATSTHIIYLDTNGQTSSNLKDKVDYKNLNFFVGPEGGFSPTEKDFFKKENSIAVKISENILRSETAGMAFLAQVLG